MGVKGYKHPGRKHPVVAVKPDGSMGGYFEFIKDACDIYGMDRHSITDSCRRGTICYGFRWMYDEDYRRYFEQQRTHELAYTLDPNRDRLTYHFKKGHKAGNGRDRMSPETLQRLARQTAEHTRRMHREGKFPHPTKPCKCLSTGRSYPSVKAAAADLGLNPAHISAAISRGGTVHGLRFVKLQPQECSVCGRTTATSINNKDNQQ